MRFFSVERGGTRARKLSCSGKVLPDGLVRRQWPVWAEESRGKRGSHE